MSDFLSYLNSEESQIILFDGATGTSFQNLNLTPNDFGGESLEGCNENLVLTNPGAVEIVHNSFLEAGCHVIETNTFGASSIVLKEYALQDKAYEINKKAALIAKRCAQKFDTKIRPRFVAGSIGPTTKLPTLGHIDFEELKISYIEQARGLIDGGVDLLILETCQDVLQIKSALLAFKNVFKEKNITLPIMVSLTIESTGTMLVGSDISTALTILEPFSIDILGLNCATGPEQMKEHIKYLSSHSKFIISCIPNAGLPENVGGKAHYRLTPIELKMQLMNFICDYGVKIIGGCCGTTPEHIKYLSNLLDELNDKSPTNKLSSKRSYFNERGASSLYSKVNYKQDSSFLIIGERLNASGSKKVRELLNKDDWDGLVNIAKDQEKENAHILDVNIDYVGRDGVSDMKDIVSRLVSKVNLPLMIDSTDSDKLESGLIHTGGKCIINSTNYEDGYERFYKVLSLAKDYGAGIVIGTIDEEGMARTSTKKVEIAKRAYKDAINIGVSPEEIFYDPLALPISTGIEEDRLNAYETIKAIKIIKEELKECHIILGISNISFGLRPAARINLNSIFLNECITNGLDSAILSPSKILPLNKIKQEDRDICKDLIYDKRKFDSNNICISDPLVILTKKFESTETKDLKINNIKKLNRTLEEQLKFHIIDGEKIGLEELLKQGLKKYKPLEIINTFLLDGMKVVGELFGAGEMQLPFVLQSAETMKYAVSILEPYMDKIEGESSYKGKFLIATVKGDVHDIGKNLVDIILTNNGYQVINLGIKQDVSKIIEAQEYHKADCIAMSGLLVKSTAFMKDNLDSFNNAGINVPVILGGAALTPKFVNEDCRTLYNGKIIYGKDAFTDLRFMDAYMLSKSKGDWDNNKGFLDSNEEVFKLNKIKHNNNINQQKKVINIKDNIDINRSEFITRENIIKSPFWGTKVIKSENIKLKDLLKYLDKNALFSGQWQMKRLRGQTSEEYRKYLNKVAEPLLDKWIDIIYNQNLVYPSAVYGYFRCYREDNSVILLDSKLNNICQFNFPRQRSKSKLCISDYFNDKLDNNSFDVFPMQAVTMGLIASEYANKLFNEDSYKDYLIFHGLTVQLAEAFAEYIHAKIRIECGFKHLEPNNTKDYLSQKYRGSRFSFGYPACPNTRDSLKQIELLETSRIGLSMDESDQLHPEQSTTAIIALHSEAKYFSA
tara:strand:+ start:67474 stop:71028 length:3555 start_codon:yes stop_codon:yes gene_type:complete